MSKIKFMQKVFFIILLTVNILTLTYSNATAQEATPTYQSLMSMGDSEFNKQEYIKAKSYYQEALRIKKDDPTAKSKLNKTLQKIRELSEKEETFFALIDEADMFFENGEYEKALSSYNKARNIFPKDEYTLEQIEKTNEIITVEKEKIASFNEMIKLADNFMSQSKYTEACIQYKSALDLYPNNANVKGKYDEAKKLKENHDQQSSNFERLKSEAKEFTLRKKYGEAIEKYQEALTIFPNDEDVKNVIKELIAQKNIADSYNLKINQADSLYSEKSYEKAKTAYNEALAVIPDDSYASNMISRIDETLNSDEYKSMKNYLNLIEEAKTLESNNEIDAALAKYQSALRLNPNDEFTTQKIEYLSNTINNRNKEIELNAQYATLINKGDNSISNEDYYSAIEYYTQAYELLPNKTEAKEKVNTTQKIINEIEAKLALEKQKWEEYYNTAMSNAQSHMITKNYSEAIKEYKTALRYKENDPNATSGLEEATKLNNEKLAAVMAEYQQYISNADTQYESNNLDKAVEFYTKALALNTGDPYPSEMINKISKILQENKLEVLVSENLQIKSNSTKRFTFKPIDVTTRKGNYILIKAKNLSDRQFTLFVSYGSNKGNSGSFIIRIPNNKETNDFIIRIGSQYKWFSEDNTWIEIIPENGDIEIESMEITKGN